MSRRDVSSDFIFIDGEGIPFPKGYDGRCGVLTDFAGLLIFTQQGHVPIYLGKDNKFHELKVNKHA